MDLIGLEEMTGSRKSVFLDLATEIIGLENPPPYNIVKTAEKALMPQPSPLTASDEYMRTRDAGIEVIRVTAGLHRQVWVSGTSIYVDMHIVNSSRKTIKKIELQLERDILCYKHVRHHTGHGKPSIITKQNLYRLQHQRWKSQLARHAFLTVMNAQSSAKLLSSKVQQAGTESLLTQLISGLAI